MLHVIEYFAKSLKLSRSFEMTPLSDQSYHKYEGDIVFTAHSVACVQVPLLVYSIVTVSVFCVLLPFLETLNVVE